MKDHGAVRTIAIVGGGIVGLSAASLFARALPGTQVTVIDTAPSATALADILPLCWPGIERFHAAIGLNEHELVRSGSATHHLGTLFEGWSSNRTTWVHAFGKYGKPANGIPFDQVWPRAREAGDAASYDEYSPGAALGRANKFIHPGADPKEVGLHFEYGLRLDPHLYREKLKRKATSFGAEIIGAEIAEVDQTDSGIEAILLTNGRKIRSDLYVDCSGSPAILISGVDDSFEDWSRWMPFDHLSVASETSSEIPSPLARARATTAGWSIEFPLRGRKVIARLSAGGDGGLIRRGRRVRPWVRNVLAIGDAATALDPLHGLNLDVALKAMALVLEILPGRDFNPLVINEYNRRSEQLTGRVRDFVALHYFCSGRTSGAWADLDRGQLPPTLAQTLDQYEYRGRMPFYEDESLSRDIWAAALLGLGVIPRNIDPAAAEVPLEQAMSAMRRLRREIHANVSRLPSYADYLAMVDR